MYEKDIIDEFLDIAFETQRVIDRAVQTLPENYVKIIDSYIVERQEYLDELLSNMTPDEANIAIGEFLDWCITREMSI